jgi:hypothetical protein
MPATATKEMALGRSPPNDVFMADEAGSAAVAAHQGWIVAALSTCPLVQFRTDLP